MTIAGSRWLVRASVQWRLQRLRHVPRPSDRPLVAIHGGRPVEVLVAGGSPFCSWGVASHQVGLLGATGRALARRLGRGVTVRGVVEPGLTAAAVRARADDIPWGQADAVILSVGTDDVGMVASPRRWERDLARLLDTAIARVRPGVGVAVTGVPPVSAVPIADGLGMRMLAALAARYNERTVALCRERGAVFVPLGRPGPAPPGQYRSPEQFQRWGEVVAAAVPFDPRIPAPDPRPEGQRALAVERLGILDTPPDPRFDRVVRTAREVFRTSSAAFTVLHGDRQWYKAKVGVDADELPRDRSLCEIAIRQGRPLVVGDAWADERFAGNPYLRAGDGVRFYAGYPLRTPDGHLIGALCVFDPDPRDAADVDLSILRDLAVMIESELGT